MKSFAASETVGSYFLDLPLSLRRSPREAGSYFLVKYEFLRRLLGGGQLLPEFVPVPSPLARDGGQLLPRES